MIRTSIQIINPLHAGPADPGLMKRLLRHLIDALRPHRTRAVANAGERKQAVMKRDLAYLDRHQLRDIGLDRDSL